MLAPGDVVAYLEMCREEGVNLQRGMNYRIRGESSVLLMSVRPGAPYADRVEDEGRILIYEGHDHRPRVAVSGWASPADRDRGLGPRSRVV